MLRIRHSAKNRANGSIMLRQRPAAVVPSSWGRLFYVSIVVLPLLLLRLSTRTTTTTTEAFQIGHTTITLARPRQLIRQSSSSSSSSSLSPSALWGKAKRGRLGSILEEDGGIAAPSSISKNKPASAKKKKPAGGASKSISPDLAKFMQQKGDGKDTESTPISTVESEGEDDVSASTFTQFESETSSKTKKKKQQQRVKQSVRQQLDAERAATVEAIVAELETIVEAAGDENMVEKVVAQLRRLPAGDSLSYKALPKPSDYRLLWAGSQEAVSAVGTGLFNVPLARLQEVFLCVNQNKQLQWLEVIRILGPFPNVRNTLTGNLLANVQAKSSSNNNKNKWKIAWDSLIDGTGKEVFADELRHVDVNAYYVDEPILVLVTSTAGTEASSSSDGSTTLLDNPENILVFVREDDLDDKLERYRVA